MTRSDREGQRFFIPAVGCGNPHCTEETIRRSRFLAQACECSSRLRAMEFVGQIRQQNADATHNCWAYVAGSPGDTASIGSSDDGEPHGTAGRPMLNALLHSGIGRVCVVVSRWFGGIKLGTGGLVRAYQDAVLHNLESLPVVEAVPKANWRIECQYPHLAAIKRLLQGLEADLEAETFAEEATIIVSLPKVYGSQLASEIANASNGMARLSRLEQQTNI